MMVSTAAKSGLPVRRSRSTEGRDGGSGRSARRWFLVVAPTLAGLLAVVGAMADPAPEATGRALYEAYADRPGSVQIKALAYHFAYALWGVAAILLAGLVRSRSIWMANVAGFLALLGVATLPGFILADFYDSAIGQVAGIEAALNVENAMGEMWALPVLGASGAIGFFLALPLAALAAWRAGLITWWAVLAVIGGIVAGFGALGPTISGAVVLTAGLAVSSVARSRESTTAVRTQPCSHKMRPANDEAARSTPFEVDEDRQDRSGPLRRGP
jgi:hypothetical protein